MKQQPCERVPLPKTVVAVTVQAVKATTAYVNGSAKPIRPGRPLKLGKCQTLLVGPYAVARIYFTDADGNLQHAVWAARAVDQPLWADEDGRLLSKQVT